MGVASQYNMSDSFFLWHVWKWVIDLLMCVLFACAATKPAIVTNDTASITSDLLWPKPTSANFGSNIYTVDQNLEFTKDGPGGNSDVFEAAIARYKALIFKTPSPFYPSGNEGRASGTLSSVTVTISSDDETLDLHTNESCRFDHCLYRVNNRTNQYLDAHIPSPEHAIFMKLISLDRTVNADLIYS